MQAGPMTPALKTRILRNRSNKAFKADDTSASATQQVTIPPTRTESVETTEPIQSGESGIQPSLDSSPPEDDASDSLSYTSTLPDVFEVGSDDSAPPATGPWMAIDHLTGEMIVDEEVLPATTAVADAPYDSTIQVKMILGVPALIQSPLPALLFVDKDERSDWLIRSINEHFQYTPYYMCLGEVFDLFLAQEARLGYPAKVAKFHLPHVFVC